jgi:hypothetical protein
MSYCGPKQDRDTHMHTVARTHNKHTHFLRILLFPKEFFSKLCVLMHVYTMCACGGDWRVLWYESAEKWEFRAKWTRTHTHT